MAQHNMVDPAIFQNLQAQVDDDQEFRDKIKELVQDLEKKTRTAHAFLSRVHSTPPSQYYELSRGFLEHQAPVWMAVKELSRVASQQPYYKWNQVWSRQVQDAIFCTLLTTWLAPEGQSVPGVVQGSLATLDDVGRFFLVPVNVKDEDVFHITIDEYLQALISLLDELARLARNSVTLGDYRRPLQIAQFIKDVHAGFQILNLKNDALRRRSDGIKYRVKEVEDVVYDLSLRGLIPKE